METAAIVLGMVMLAVGVVLALASRRRTRASETRADEASRSARELRAELRSADAQRREMRLVLSSMDEGVLLFGPDGRLRFANDAAERLLGARPATVHAILPLRLREAVRSATEGVTTATANSEVGTPTRSLRGTATPVGGDGSALLVLVDVTEAVRIERVRRDFVANASHELKTPAASIQATAETIKTAAAEDPAEVPRFAGQLEREAVRLSRIVSDLLDLSRLESGSADEGSVGLEGIVRGEAERCASTASRANVRLTVDATSVPAVSGSARDLSLLVRNLLDNAIRYTAPGGRVTASVRPDGDHVVVTISDTGVGVPSRDLDRIFERFYRVDRARSRETGGTGLGLSIVKHVVENHGGTISVDSELGRGTTFEVRLPTVTA